MPGLSTAHERRHRADRCPGVLRPWVAEDGALVRIRLVGGLLHRTQLAGLADLASEYGDGTLHLTARANLQLRGISLPVPDLFVERVAALGLLPSRAHERVRNIMVSPLTGRLGGLADLRPTARALDAAVCADPMLSDLPARFLFCLDDRGDLQDRPTDLAAVVVAPGRARLLAGALAGEVVGLQDVPARMADLARRFLTLRGTGPSACWHVGELDGEGSELGSFGQAPAQPSAPVPMVPPHGSLIQDDGRRALHLAVPGGSLTPALLEQTLAAGSDEVIVTPWRSLFLPDLDGDS
jgi:precorrin-3B synthase